MEKIAIITINKPGEESADKLIKIIKNNVNNCKIEKDTLIKTFVKNKERKIIDLGENFYKETYTSIDKLLAQLWKNFNTILCFLATGIIVRKIAKLIESKTTDPAILAMSFDLKLIVPLLSGHIGGANEFAGRLKNIIPNLTVFITTATDQNKIIAFDLFAKNNNFQLYNIQNLKTISNALLNKEKINVLSYPAITEKIKNEPYYNYIQNKELIRFQDILKPEVNESNIPTVIISPLLKHKKENSLFIQIKPIYLGIGINRDTDFEIIKEALLIFMDKYQLSIKNIKYFASFSAKKDEEGLKKLSDHFNKNILFYEKGEINALSQKFSKSQANHYFGIKGVAEPSSILASKYKTCFIKKNTFFKAVTIAAAF